MTADLGILGQPGAPWCLSLAGSAQDVTGHGYTWAQAGLTVRFLRGRKMGTYQGVFDEFGAALQFPWYFGENGHAFAECMGDLSWLPPQAGYALLVTDPGLVLAQTADGGLSWLVESLGAAAGEWASPVAEGQPWDRPPVPFHVVLQAAEGVSDPGVGSWAASGATIAAAT